MAVSQPGYTSETYVQAERAVIIWDSVHHVEHFIRQASFQTRSPDLGFLVPTPQTPELAEVDPRIFDMAADIGGPRPVAPVFYHTPWDAFAPIVDGPVQFLEEGTRNLERATDPDFIRNRRAALTPAASKMLSRNVVFEQDVAGYHATVLSTDDYASITAWLTNNGYTPTPEMEKWLKPYAAAKWKITAFKMIPDNARTNDAKITTRAVRLSFPSEQPFYPYSEPSDRQQAAAASPLGRALRLTILSDHPVAGNLADKNPWPGKLQYAGPSAPSSSNKGQWDSKQWLAFAHLDGPGQAVALPTELTTFLDESNPRPGTSDLYFSPNPKQPPFRADWVDYSLPKVDKFDLSQPFPDLAAFLFIVLIPGAPLYCGWRTIRLSRAKVAPDTTSPSSIKWRRRGEKLLGIVAIILGILLCIPFGIIFIGGVASIISDPGTGILETIISFPALGMCLAMVHCGIRISRNKIDTANGSLRERSPFLKKWDKAMGIGSFTAGTITVIALVITFRANMPV